MIGPGTGVRVYLACGVTDMRKGDRWSFDAGAGCATPEADGRCGVCLSWASG